MENQTPEAILSSQKPRSNFVLWIVVGIAILAVGIAIGLVVGKYSSPSVDDQKPVQKTELPATSPSVAPVEIEDPIASWKTYTNEKYGFLFKYPSEWKIQTRDVYNERYHGEGFYLMTCSTSALVISLLDLSRPDAVYKSVDDYLKTPPFNSPAFQWKDIYVAGISGKYYKETGDPGSVTPSASVILFNKFKNSIINLRFTDPCGKGIDQAISDEFDQILSTFKFIN